MLHHGENIAIGIVLQIVYTEVGPAGRISTIGSGIRILREVGPSEAVGSVIGVILCATD